MKRNPADIAFSDAIRESRNYTCERCNKYYPEGHRRGIECSHYYGRRAYATRYCLDNCDVLCTGCHMYFSANPAKYEIWKTEKMGEGAMQLLAERKNNTNLAKSIKKDLKAVKAHYKSEHERMKKLRADGVTGRIEFTGWV